MAGRVTAPPSRSYRHGKRHKGASSPETRRWTEVSADTAWLGTEDGHADVHADLPQPLSGAPTTSNHDPVAPSMPSWLTPDVYEALLELREGLQA